MGEKSKLLNFFQEFLASRIENFTYLLNECKHTNLTCKKVNFFHACKDPLIVGRGPTVVSSEYSEIFAQSSNMAHLARGDFR